MDRSFVRAERKAQASPVRHVHCNTLFRLCLLSFLKDAIWNCFPRQLWYNDHRIAKSIEDSIDFAAKRQVWQRMILWIIRPILIAMNIWQNSRAVLLRREAARRNAFWLSAII